MHQNISKAMQICNTDLTHASPSHSGTQNGQCLFSES